MKKLIMAIMLLMVSISMFGINLTPKLNNGLNNCPIWNQHITKDKFALSDTLVGNIYVIDEYQVVVRFKNVENNDKVFTEIKSLYSNKYKVDYDGQYVFIIKISDELEIILLNHLRSLQSGCTIIYRDTSTIIGKLTTTYTTSDGYVIESYVNGKTRTDITYKNGIEVYRTTFVVHPVNNPNLFQNITK